MYVSLVRESPFVSLYLPLIRFVGLSGAALVGVMSRRKERAMLGQMLLIPPVWCRFGICAVN